MCPTFEVGNHLRLLEGRKPRARFIREEKTKGPYAFYSLSSRYNGDAVDDSYNTVSTRGSLPTQHCDTIGEPRCKKMFSFVTQGDLA